MAGASSSSTGASSMTESRKISVKMPPMPARTIGPKTGSRLHPRISSVPGRAIFCTSSAKGMSGNLFFISRTARSSAAVSLMFKETPPLSVLCGTASEQIFNATGNPSRPAASAASASVWARMPSMTGIPDCLSRDAPSNSLRIFKFFFKMQRPPCRANIAKIHAETLS